MDTGESTEQTVKTIAQGMPLFSVVPVVTTLVCFFSLHARLRVQQNTRYSLRPLLFEGHSQRLGRNSAAGMRGCANKVVVEQVNLSKTNARRTLCDVVEHIVAERDTQVTFIRRG